MHHGREQEGRGNPELCPEQMPNALACESGSTRGRYVRSSNVGGPKHERGAKDEAYGGPDVGGDRPDGSGKGPLVRWEPELGHLCGWIV